MRLTKEDKSDFVANVMRDVPKRDFGKEARKIILDDSIANLPKEIQNIISNPGLKMYINMSGYFGRIRDYFPRESAVVYLHGNNYKISDSALKEFNAIVAEKEAIDNLAVKVAGIIAGCNTLKQAIAALPEFVKYLPEERMAIKTLPAISNTVAALTKAGWPKEVTK
jgi:hypothetical protein